MSSIMSFIEGYMTGNAWEELCVQCYRIRYQCDDYTAIPATQGGDAGIEGFTNKGIVHQCYCPERSYSDNDLYNHQRDKLTTDIEKLMKNASRFRALGVPPVIEWHLNIPEYKDSRILAHAETKRQEIVKAKNDKPADYTHIADGFRIVIKTAEYFTPEISRIIRTTLTNTRLNVAYEVYGMTRTGCCGCSISSKAVDDLEKIRPYEPNLVKAAWNIFGESYRYRQKYNEYKAMRRQKPDKSQISFTDLEGK